MKILLVYVLLNIQAWAEKPVMVRTTEMSSMQTCEQAGKTLEELAGKEYIKWKCIKR